MTSYFSVTSHWIYTNAAIISGVRGILECQCKQLIQRPFFLHVSNLSLHPHWHILKLVTILAHGCKFIQWKNLHCNGSDRFNPNSPDRDTGVALSDECSWSCCVCTLPSEAGRSLLLGNFDQSPYPVLNCPFLCSKEADVRTEKTNIITWLSKIKNLPTHAHTHTHTWW